MLRLRHTLAWLVIGVGLGCSDSAAPARHSGPTTPPPFVASLASSGAGTRPVVYVSLPAGSIPNGTEAHLRVVATGITAVAPMVDGGFGPVALAAIAGDTVAIVVETAGGEAAVEVRVEVKPDTPPVIVRTEPKKGKRDVPLNPRIAVIFSEPVDPATLTNGAVQLRSGGVAVGGVLQFTDTTHTEVAFIPSEPLAASTDYELVVSQAVRDAGGSPLAAPASIPFTTVAAPPAQFALTVAGAGAGSGGVASTPNGIACTLAASIASGACSASYVRGTTVTLTATPGAGSGLVSWTGAAGCGVALTCAVTMDRAYTVVATFMTLGARLVLGSIGTAPNHACALEAQTGLAYCWGDYHAGALGIGERDWQDGLMWVSDARRFSSISVASYTTCAIEASTGFAYCWGENKAGELGDGTTTTRWEPTLVGSGLRRFSQVSSGEDVTCGIEAQTDLGYCWGKGELLGNGTVFPRSIPTLVGGGSLQFSSISVGEFHVCGVEAQTGLAYCWGGSRYGEIGDGTLFSRPVPTLVGGGSRRFSRVDAGVAYTCGIEAQTDLVYCWGRNDSGQLGDGTTTDRLVPTMVGGSRRFSSVDASYGLTCGVEAQTGVGYCWGRNEIGQVGDGTATADRRVPTLVGGGSPRFSSIASAGWRACGVEAQTGLGYCWGTRLVVPTLLPPPVR